MTALDVMVSGAKSHYEKNSNASTALRSFSEKTSKKSTCVVMIRIIITFENQIFV